MCGIGHSLSYLSNKMVTKICLFLSYVLGFYVVSLIKSPVVFYSLLDI